MSIETVTVNRNGTKVIINKDDFDPDKDVLWSDGETKSRAKPKGKAD